jgi:acyl-CoA hydrolase
VPSKSRRLTAADAAALVRPVDSIATGFAGGQADAILEAIGARTDLTDVVLFAGLFSAPYRMLLQPGVRVVSGFFGPVERAARKAGARIEYLAADFHGLEALALRLKPRLVLAVTTPPDADGWLSFGIHPASVYRPFLQAAADPERLAVAQVNPRMPRLAGLPELGGNRVHVSEVDVLVEHPSDLPALPAPQASSEDLEIARQIDALVESGSTLQFGIGAIPNEVARALAAGSDDDLGLHTEMLSDGAMVLHRAGKVSNRKGLYDGVTVATFALGGADLYAWLQAEGAAAVRMLPVGSVNDPALLRRLRNFVSINGALAVDLLGQIAADHVGGHQYSGVGGHDSFVMGAREAPGGKSIVCLRSTATVGGQRVSTIVPRIGTGMTVTTPRHHAQWVVTEHGAVDLSPLGDRSRAAALIELAHPDFRDELRAASAG